MQCPNCQETMENEVGYASNWRGNKRQLCGVDVLYTCPGCGREFRWTKGLLGLRPMSEYDDDPPMPAWCEEE